MKNTMAFYTMHLRDGFTKFCITRLHTIGLSLGQMYFILYIAKHPNCTQKEVINYLKMDSAHVTRTLSKLEKAEFIIQKINENDRRSRILQLTSKGEEAFTMCKTLFIEWDNLILEELDNTEKQLLLNILAKLTSNDGGKDNAEN